MTHRYRHWLGLLAAAGGLAAGCGRSGSGSPAPTPDAGAGCAEMCVVEVENRSAMQLEVVLRDGLSVRSLGQISGYTTAKFEIPVGIPARYIDARLTPGAAVGLGASRSVNCHFQNRSAPIAGRLVCDLRRG